MILLTLKVINLWFEAKVDRGWFLNETVEPSTVEIDFIRRSWRQP